MESRHSYRMAYAWRSLHEGGLYMEQDKWQGKGGHLSAGDRGGGLIGREIQYAIQSHFNTYNFQIQWIILQL